MIEKFIKRSFYFSPELLAEWEFFHRPSKDYSPSAAAAFLLYMVVEPNIREVCRRLACEKDIKKARLEARKILRQTIADAYLTGFLGIFSEEDRIILREQFAVKSDEKNKEEPAPQRPLLAIFIRLLEQMSNGEIKQQIKLLPFEEQKILLKFCDIMSPGLKHKIKAG